MRSLNALVLFHYLSHNVFDPNIRYIERDIHIILLYFLVSLTMNNYSYKYINKC